MKHDVSLLWSLALSLLIVGCAYSFRGASVPSHIKTVAIPIVEDQSGFGEPGLRERFTNELIARFINDNSLEIADKLAADSMLEGVITMVRDDASVVEAGEQVTKRRITVSITMVYHDLKLRKKMWEKEFTNWGDWEPAAGLQERENGLQQAINKITEDILIDTVSGW